jgi:chromosome partitioning protein
MAQSFSAKKAFAVFGADPTDGTSVSLGRKSYPIENLSDLGEDVGFFKKPERPVAASIFVTKGGVLKTTLTLNLARMAALHGLKVCVVGLDMQGDITQTLGNEGPDENESLEEALRTLNSLKGLSDLFVGQATLDEILVQTEIPNLSYIPETPELVALDQSLLSRNRREYWLKETVIEPLKAKFDLILMDCSPNWNRLINNALVASDVLISPIESKINNFRNLRTFRALISEFRRDMRLDFKHTFVPTRVVASRRLSREIFDWYRENLDTPEATPVSLCTSRSIRESIHGEEAMALRLSIPEHSPNSVAAAEIRLLLAEIGDLLGISVPRDSLRLILDRAKLGGTPATGAPSAEANATSRTLTAEA